MARLKVAISGLGGHRPGTQGQGRNHLKTYRLIPDVEVVGLYDPNQEWARQVADETEVSRVYASLDDLLADKDIDVLSIAAPCPYHGEQALAGLSAGKHVLVEVGLDGFSLDRLWQIVKAAEQNDRKVQVGNHMRWDPATLAMKRLIDEGKIGDVFYAESEYIHDLSYLMGQEPNGSATWRNGFGKLPQPSMSSGGGIHAIDTIRWIMGNVEFVEVFGYGNRICKPWRDVDDLEVALFKTRTDAVVKVVVSKALKRPSSQAYGVYGTRGTAEKPRNDGRTAAFGGGGTPVLFSEDPGPVNHHPPMEEIAVGLPDIDPERAALIGHGGLTLLEFEDFIQAILDDTQPRINVYEGARSSAAGICAWKSIQEGRPVKIPQFPDRSTDYARFRVRPLANGS